MPTEEPIVAVGLLRQADLDQLGSSFTHWYSIDETPCFNELLRAIDVADRKYRELQTNIARPFRPRSGR